MSKNTAVPVSLLCAVVSTSAAFAQSGSGDWTTTGFDAQRSFWVKRDAKISPESMRRPGFELVWKLNVNEMPRQQSSLTPPVLLDFYIGYRGFRSLAFLATSAGGIIGIDSDLGRIEWKKQFKASSTPQQRGSNPCSTGMMFAVTRSTGAGYPPVPALRGTGRGTPAKSGVGEPSEGAVTLKQTPARRPVPAPPPVKPASSNRRVSAPSNPFAPRVQFLHALAADGKFHSLYVSNGDEPKDAVPFLPSGANVQGLIVVDNTAYVSTTDGCPGVDNGVWALDLESQKVNQWKSGGAMIAGSAGPAMGPDGTLYVTAGGKLVALEERTLQPKGSYSIETHEFASSAVVFDFKEKDLIAAGSTDGRLHLLDSAALSKPLNTTSPISGARFAPQAPASWRDAAGTRWVLAPATGPVTSTSGFRSNGEVKNGAILAWKVEEQNGSPVFQPGWISRDMVGPLTPIVVNGVIFAVASGEPAARDPKTTGTRNTQRPSHAILYAFDALDGKELWNSADTMKTSLRSGGLAAGGSRIYVSTQDGTQYAFGFPIEH